MNNLSGKVFIGTVLLEKNRWKSRIPSLKVSEWISRFSEDGFDGIELWENHALLCEQGELDAIEASNFPVAVYNSYVGFGDEAEDVQKREKAAAIINRLDIKAVKFNFGNDLSLRNTYINNLKAWVAMLPKDCRILCECHEGTIMEEPEAAAGIFKELGQDCYQAIVHPFSDNKLEKWFEHLGKTITHAHVTYCKEDYKREKLSSNLQYVKQCLQIMKNAGFKGTYTIEFTEGIGTPGENIEDVYKCAVEDFKFIMDNIK